MIIQIQLFSKVRTKDTVQFYVSSEKVNWTNAGKQCQMIGADEIRKINVQSLNQSQPMSEYAWINAPVYFTPWTLYYGCNEYKRENYDIYQKPDPMPFCIRNCTFSLNIGLQDSMCWCVASCVSDKNITFRSCTAQSCMLDQHSLCAIAPKHVGSTYAVFGIVNLTALFGTFDNCLSGSHDDKTNDGVFATCEEKLNLNCGSVMLQNYLISTNTTYNTQMAWSINSGVKKIEQYYSLLTPKRTWNKYSGRSEKDHAPGENPEYCAIAKVQKDGSIIRGTKKCDELLHVLCKVTGGMSSYKGTPPSMDNTPRMDTPNNVDTYSVDGTPSTDDIPTICGTPTIDDSTDDIPTICGTPNSIDNTPVSDEMPSSTDTLVIISVVSSVVILIFGGITVLVFRLTGKVTRTKDPIQTDTEMPIMLNVNDNTTFSPENNSLCTNNQPAFGDMIRKEHTCEPLDESHYATINDVANENANTSGERDIIELDSDGYVRSTARVTIHEYTYI